MIATEKTRSGQVVFLEKGNSRAGLQHIVERHAKDFENIGVSEAQIPSVVMKALKDNKIIGYQGKDKGRPIYETTINGEKHKIAITTGSERRLGFYPS